MLFDKLIRGLTPEDLSSVEVASYKCLVIDDNKHAAMLNRAILHGFGFGSVEVRCSAMEAYVMANNLFFDLILIDYFMEPLDGITFIRNLRANQSSPNRCTPVILVSGYADEKVIRIARKAGANSVVAKPVAPRVLLRAIATNILTPSPFIISPDYTGPCRMETCDTELVEQWKAGETLPDGVFVVSPPRARRWKDAKMKVCV